MNMKNEKLNNDKYGFKEISLDELNELYKDDIFIPYAQYLRTHNWQSKRLEILDRDDFRCKNCGGYETKPLKTKISTPFGTVEGNSYSIDWDDKVYIFWTDINGNGRTSELTRPQHKPDKPYNLQIHHKKYIFSFHEISFWQSRHVQSIEDAWWRGHADHSIAAQRSAQ